MGFSIQTMVQKGVKSAVKAAIGLAFGFLVAHNIDLAHFGVTVDQGVLVDAVAGGVAVAAVAILEGLRNFLKQKLNIGWL